MVDSPCIIAGFILSFSGLLRPSEVAEASAVEEEERVLRNCDVTFTREYGRLVVTIVLRRRKNMQQRGAKRTVVLRQPLNPDAWDLVAGIQRVHRPDRPTDPLLWQYTRRT
jgi:hypothetical protein